MGIQNYVDIYHNDDKLVKVGKAYFQLLGKTVVANGLKITFDNEEKAKTVFQQIRQKIESLNLTDSQTLYESDYVYIGLGISAVWEYRIVRATDGEYHFSTQNEAKEFFDNLKSKAGQEKVADILGQIATMSNSVDLNSSGYQILPSGLIIQWGFLVANTDGNGVATYTFPKEFPNNCFTVICVDSGEACVDFGVLDFNKSTFTVKARNADGSVRSNAPTGCRFLAIGF